jgi:RIO-like serine/threonine protein kinase
MNVNIISQFISGRSGAKVYLAEKNGIVGVYKTNVKDPYGVYELSKKLPFRTPEIYDISDDSIFMEYINGRPLKDVLRDNDPIKIEIVSDFILSYVDYALNSSLGMYDFSEIINKKIEQVSEFVSTSYLSNIKTVYPTSITHGDFTFDNMIYCENEVCLIDLSPTPFTSVYFDMNKLRQDLTGYWFVRQEPSYAPWVSACNKIYSIIDTKHPSMFDDGLYNLMISRILPYCKNNDFDFNYVLNMLIG